MLRFLIRATLSFLSRPMKVKLGLLGAGAVGAGVWDLLERNREKIEQAAGAELEIVKVGVRDISKKRSIPAHVMPQDLKSVIDSADVVLEAMGGLQPAGDLIQYSFRQRKPVITANKKLIAHEGEELFRLNREYGVPFRFETAVASGVPVIQPLTGLLSSNDFLEIEAILNGTTNYILWRMATTKMSYADALKEAQELQYAEADPTDDVEGWDATYKLIILIALCFGIWLKPDQIDRVGITQVTQEQVQAALDKGKVLKLLANAVYEDGRIVRAQVKPTEIERENFLYDMNEAFNGVGIHAKPVGWLFWSGPGAGSGPSASSMLGDTIEVVKRISHHCALTTT